MISPASSTVRLSRRWPDVARSFETLYEALCAEVVGLRSAGRLDADLPVGAGDDAVARPRVLSEIKNRGVSDVCMLGCDGLKGLPDAVSSLGEDDRPDMH